MKSSSLDCFRAQLKIGAKLVRRHNFSSPEYVIFLRRLLHKFLHGTAAINRFLILLDRGLDRCEHSRQLLFLDPCYVELAQLLYFVCFKRIITRHELVDIVWAQHQKVPRMLLKANRTLIYVQLQILEVFEAFYELPD